MECWVKTKPEKRKMAELGMQNEHRKILRRNFIAIAEEMQADQVLRKMKDIFTEWDEEEIRAETSERRRAEKMLDILQRRGEHAFRKFLDALWEIQPWLARHLAEQAGLKIREQTQRSPRLGMKEVHRDLLRKHLTEFQRTLNIEKIVPDLVKVGVLNENVAQQTLEQRTRISQVEKLILDVLPKCGPEAFVKFYRCLESLQPTSAHDFKVMIEKSDHPEEVPNQVNCHQESDKHASSNEEMITSPLHTSNSSYSLSSKCSELPEEVSELLERVLDEPADELFSNDWQMLYKELGLPKGKEDLIKKRGGSPTSHVMKSWIKVQGKEATVQHLLSVLKKCHHGDLVSRIENILGVEHKEADVVGYDVVDNVRKLNIENSKPVKRVGDISQKLKPHLIEHLSVLDVGVLAKLATNITERQCYVRDASDFLEKIKTYQMRILFRELRKEKQQVVVQWMRKKLPAGSTGPVVLDDESRANEMPYLHRREITKILTANGEWQIVAGQVGLQITDIKILELRGKDPAEDVLSYWEVRSGTTVGALYDLLVECELCNVADML